MIGRTLGRYEIVRQIGEGGMGVVYQARDTELERDVAIKVLPPEIAELDKARRARFEREAKAIAALPHPNICTLHDVGHVDGIHFLVMELLDGESLADRLAYRPLTLDQVLRHGAEIADALASAHTKGIIHRDLKPGNVMLTKTGAKLLDFGIAHVLRPMPEEARDASTDVKPLTGDGEILGTVRYMAPEQIEGKQTDARTDIFGLGVVLYEMVTGKRAFEGDSRASLAAAILSAEPRPVSELKPDTPPILEHVIRRCLEKDPDDRWQSALDLAKELRRIAGHAAGEVPAAEPRVTRRNRMLLGAVASLIAAAAVVAAFWIGRGLPQEHGPAVAPATSRPKLVRLTWEPAPEHSPSISPDGSSFVYVAQVEPGNWDIFFRRIGGETAINLTEGCSGVDRTPSFSPDGQSIAYSSECDGGGIFIMGATGESRRLLTDFGTRPRWSPDGSSVAFHAFGKKQGLWIADVVSGSVRQLLEENASQPTWSPSGIRIAFHRIDEETATWSLATVAVDGGFPTDVLTLSGRMRTTPFWTRDGILFNDGAESTTNVSRVRVDESTGEMLEEVEVLTRSTTWARWASATMDGRRVLFASGNYSVEWGVSSFDPDGEAKLSNWRSILVDPRTIKGLYPSPDGEWVATLNFQHFPGDISHAGDESWTDVMLIRTSTGETVRLTNDDAEERPFGWTPDGTRVLFNRHEGGPWEVWWIRPDGSGLERVAAGQGAKPLSGVVISPDGRWLYARQGGNSPDELSCVIDLDVPFGERIPEALPLLPDGRTFVVGDLSPDGRWVSGRARGNPPRNVYLYDVEQRRYTKLTDDYYCVNPVGKCFYWLPDSRRILLALDGGKKQLALLDRVTGEVTVFANPSAPIERAALSRDGRLLFTFQYHEEDDIWMLDYGEAQ